MCRDATFGVSSFFHRSNGARPPRAHAYNGLNGASLEGRAGLFDLCVELTAECGCVLLDARDPRRHDLTRGRRLQPPKQGVRLLQISSEARALVVSVGWAPAPPIRWEQEQCAAKKEEASHQGMTNRGAGSRWETRSLGSGA
jgi:hypothetical protein